MPIVSYLELSERNKTKYNLKKYPLLYNITYAFNLMPTGTVFIGTVYSFQIRVLFSSKYYICLIQRAVNTNIDDILPSTTIHRYDLSTKGLADFTIKIKIERKHSLKSLLNTFSHVKTYMSYKKSIMTLMCINK